MKKSAFGVMEIEVPDDMPSGLDPIALWEYLEKHQEVADRLAREYSKAHRLWLKMQDGAHAPKKNRPQQTKARGRKVSAQDKK
jgi:hypothetical protein